MSAAPCATLLTSAMLMTATLAAQRPSMAFGLRAGRHHVVVDELARHDGATPMWHPADSGRFPLVILVAVAGLSGRDSARAEYFASHGFVVVSAPGGTDAVPEALRLPFVDTAQVAKVGSVSEPVEARGIRLLWGDVGATPEDGAGITVGVPLGRSDHFRLRTALARAFLEAALGRGSMSLEKLARRVRRSGLTVIEQRPR